MRISTTLPFLAMTVLSPAICAAADQPPAESSVWNFDNLNVIGGQNVEVVGEPRLVGTDRGKAIEFDGRDDALFFDVHPLAGAKKFTVEVVFRPAAGGAAEQRFFHMQENDSQNRILFETRLTGDGRWYLDTFIKSGEGNYTQLAESSKHPVDRWFHAALVVDGNEMRHYVDGKKEMATKIEFQPQRQGRTSLGVRINKVHWFKGAIREARFTRRALKPEEFLRVEK